MFSHRRLTWEWRLVFFLRAITRTKAAFSESCQKMFGLKDSGNAFVCRLQLLRDVTLMPSYLTFNIGLGSDGQTRLRNSSRLSAVCLCRRWKMNHCRLPGASFIPPKDQQF